MAIVPFPRRMLRSLSWRQEQARPTLQRSAFTGRTRAIVLQSAARWIAEGEVVPADPARRAILAAFEALAIPPDATFRLPATEAGQVAAINIILNPDLETGTQNWTLPLGVARIAGDWTGPVDWFFRADPGAARSILANNESVWPVAAGNLLFLESWSFRSDSGALALLSVQWRDASNLAISTDSLVLDTTPGQWVRARTSALAPAGTAFAVFRYDIAAYGSGYVGLSGARASLLPTACQVNGAGQSGTVLSLKSLAPNQLHLPAGTLITVRLPAGDEQMIQLTGSLVADGAGNGRAFLATPLRSSPDNDALVELDRPWALMRAVHEPGWDVSVGPIYRHQFVAEEAF